MSVEKNPNGLIVVFLNIVNALFENSNLECTGLQ